MTKILIIVDFQRDFYEEGSPLQVPGADRAAEGVLHLLEKERFDKVVFTVDWHSRRHCSFQENGGQWPVHCVQNERGSEIHPDMLAAVKRRGFPYQVVRKGERDEEEEYGAFSRLEETPEGIVACTATDSCTFPKNAEIVVCGLAGDYCVLETLKNLQPLHPSVYVEGIASLDGGKALKAYLDSLK